MSVHARKNKSGIVYWIQNRWNKKPQWERSGTSKRQAEQDDRAMKKAIEAGTYVPKTGLHKLTVAGECEQLVKSVEGPSKEIYSDRLRLHVLSRPWLADAPAHQVEGSHIEQLVKEMRAEKKTDGTRRLSDQQIANVLEALRLVYSRAIKAKRLTDNPVVLADHDLQASDEEREPYTKTEATLLMRHTKIRLPVRVMNALAFYSGAREGELCGCKWSDIDVETPLHCLNIRRQYNGRPLKGKKARPRTVPVHPELAKALNEWATSGFELYTGRKPTPEDPIVPCLYRGELRHFTKRGFYNAFARACEVSGVPNKTLHSTRHTFTTLCRRADCNDARLREITHGKSKSRKRDISERYTHRDWEELCGVVLKLDYDAVDLHQRVHSGPKGPLFLDGLVNGSENVTGGNDAKSSTDSGCPASGHTSTFGQELCGLENPSQHLSLRSGSDYQRLAASNDKRRKRLETLQSSDPTAAAPGLFLTAALDAAYSGDRAGLEQNLLSASAVEGT